MTCKISALQFMPLNDVVITCYITLLSIFPGCKKVSNS